MNRPLLKLLVACLALAVPAVPSFAAKAKVPTPGKEGWVSLFDGTQKDLEKRWRPSNAEKNRWKAVDGELQNTENSAANLNSTVKLGDHELFIQFKVPRGGNSGVYVQGRYEIQVGDSYGQKPGKGSCGAIYSRIVPSKNMCLPIPKGKDETDWQTYRYTFHQAQVVDGKKVKNARITVEHNGTVIIDDKEIEGVTGGAVDSKEGTPFGLMLQGDHTKVKYRNIMYRPLSK